MSGTLFPVTAEPSDQFMLGPFEAGAGVTATVNAQTAKANLPTGSAAVFVFTNSATVVFNGQTLHFRNGVPYQLDTLLQNFLTAQGVSFTAV